MYHYQMINVIASRGNMEGDELRKYTSSAAEFQCGAGTKLTLLK